MPYCIYMYSKIALTSLAIVAFGGISQASAAPASIDGLEQLLLSSPWCSLNKDKTTGNSSSARYRFSGNGTYTTTTQSKSAQDKTNRNTSSNGRWIVKNGTLLAAEKKGELVQVNLHVKHNPNAAPIIVTDGVEYSKCR